MGPSDFIAFAIVAAIYLLLAMSFAVAQPLPTIACMYTNQTDEKVFIGVLAPSEEQAMQRCLARFSEQDCKMAMCQKMDE